MMNSIFFRSCALLNSVMVFFAPPCKDPKAVILATYREAVAAVQGKAE